MKAYSQDLRQRVLRAVDQGTTQAEIAKTFAVSTSTIKRYLRQRRETGHVVPKAIPGRPARKGAVLQANLREQLGSRVKEAIEAKGCRLVFLPAYSPDFSPIEEAFSKLKTFLRRVGARTREDLQEAIAQALTRITADDALGWFTHCGYPPPGTPEVVQSL